MKRIFTTAVILSFGITSLIAQLGIKPITPSKFMQSADASSTYQRPNISCSAQTAMLLMDLDKLKKQGKTLEESGAEIIERYHLRKVQGQYHVSGFLMVTPSFDESQFGQLGGTINTRANEIYTVSFPVTSIHAMATLPGVAFLQIAEKGDIVMDAARQLTGVNAVQQNTILPEAYYGEGVIVGIIDIGFQYNHPNFYSDLQLNNYRVKRVWEQEINGTPPAGFSYGRELTSESAILAAQGDMLNQSHGTHVAGIAAGSINVYTGIAPKSDLVFVSTNIQDDGIADAIEYIKGYAQSQNKPCVINMSLSKEVGPHDGTSLLDVFYDYVIEDGTILVAAAGNQGANALHLSKTFGSSLGTAQSFIKFPNNTNDAAGVAIIDIWGAAGMDYDVAVNIYNVTTSSFEDWTPYYEASNDVTASVILEDNDSQTNDHISIDLATAHYPVNNKYNTQIYINASNQDDNERYILLEIRGANGKVDAWMVSGPVFSDHGLSSVDNGTTTGTVGEIGGTGNSVISVGAYTSKNTYMSLLNGEQTVHFNSPVGSIAGFSSKGPTADSRTKPDITAPGNIIVSSISAYDGTFPENKLVDFVSDGTNTWYFGAMEGTSMASPVVTGIIALWLEAYPTLNTTEALALLKHTALRDSHTGNITAAGSNTWGWGKVQAHTGLQEILNGNIIKVENPEAAGITRIYPNPTSGMLNLQLLNDLSDVQLQVLDMSGRMYMHQTGKHFDKDNVEILQLDHLPNGIYTLRVLSNEQQASFRLVVSK
jgi:minor extracellular serine protease Vpr